MTDRVEELLSEEPVPCCLAAMGGGFLASKLPELNDPERMRIPSDMPPVIDAHVHLFPDRLFEAIWAWFDAHGWPIRYRLKTPDVIAFQLARGVEQIVALHYAHKPGIARSMNRYMAQIAAQHPQVVGTATVFPGEPDAVAILEEGFAAGLAGVKLHCHVQCFSPDAAPLAEIYETCARWDRPLIMHAGREPKSDAYLCDPHELCAAWRVEDVLRNYPGLRLVIPHLGADEFEAYAALTHGYDNLWLDTTMVLADFFPVDGAPYLSSIRPDRLLYGTDFPNIPYAWDRELLRLRSAVDDETLELVCHQNVATLYPREGAEGA